MRMAPPIREMSGTLLYYLNVRCHVMMGETWVVVAAEALFYSISYHSRSCPGKPVTSDRSFTTIFRAILCLRQPKGEYREGGLERRVLLCGPGSMNPYSIETREEDDIFNATIVSSVLD